MPDLYTFYTPGRLKKQGIVELLIYLVANTLSKNVGDGFQEEFQVLRGVSRPQRAKGRIRTPARTLSL